MLSLGLEAAVAWLFVSILAELKIQTVQSLCIEVKEEIPRAACRTLELSLLDIKSRVSR